MYVRERRKRNVGTQEVQRGWEFSSVTAGGKKQVPKPAGSGPEVPVESPAVEELEQRMGRMRRNP